MKSALNAPHLSSEEAAISYVEARLWPDGPVCPHCGTIGEASKSKGKTTRPGLWNCRACRKPFTVRMRTVFESSHVPMHIWLQAIYLMCSSKKGISTRQLQRAFGGSMKTAWFLGHRVREAMTILKISDPLGGEGKTVEIDETYIGGLEKNKHAHKRQHAGRGGTGKAPVFALVERDGSVRAFHVPNVNGANLAAIVNEHVAKGTTIYSDDNHTTKYSAHGFSREAVKHQDGEYVRGPVHTNTVEGFFSVLKRGVTGVYHSVSEAHLNRYLSEFGFRHSNRSALGIEDALRADLALQGVKGKRLTYETTRSAGRAQTSAD
jgi:transposase-like protein